MFEPEEVPEQYADYLRRCVVAAARAFLTHQQEDVCTYHHIEICDLAVALDHLDDWKKEMGLKDID